MLHVCGPDADCLCRPSGMVDSLPASLDWARWPPAAGAKRIIECRRLMRCGRTRESWDRGVAPNSWKPAAAGAPSLVAHSLSVTS